MSIIEEINKNTQVINEYTQPEVYNWAKKNNGDYNASIQYLNSKNPPLLKTLFDILPLKPTRADVKKCYEKDLYLGFVATLLWGGFNRDINTVRYFKEICTLPCSVLNNCNNNSIEKIQDRLGKIKGLFSNHSLSEIIEEASGGKIAKGISYSYASKVMYFLGYDLAVPKPIIYDSWMCYAHCALLIEMDPKKAIHCYCYLQDKKTKKYKLYWTKKSSPAECYEDFCNRINFNFKKVDEPEKLESWLFNDTIRKEYCKIVDTFFLSKM